MIVQGKCGFIDRKGKIVIKPQFDGCADFYEGLAVVMVGPKTMVINEKGQTVFEPELPLLSKFFSHGLISFCGSMGPCTPRGYLDKKGRVAIKPQFYIAQPFSEGRAPIHVDGKWGYIDKKGRTVIAPRFLQATSFSDGLALVKTNEDRPKWHAPRWVYIDKNGRIVFDPRPHQPVTFVSGFASIKRDDGRWTIIDKTWKVLFEPQFDTDQYQVVEAAPLRDGLIRITTRGPWAKQGYADLSGKIVIRPQFNWAHDFSDGLAAVQTGVSGKFGYIDTTGVVVIKPQFDRVHKFMRGIARVEIGRNVGLGPPCPVDMYCLHRFIWDAEIGYIDKTGAYIWKPTK